MRFYFRKFTNTKSSLVQNKGMGYYLHFSCTLLYWFVQQQQQNTPQKNKTKPTKLVPNLDKGGSTNCFNYPNSRATFCIEREPFRAEMFWKDGEPDWDREERVAGLSKFTLALVTNLKISCIWTHSKFVLSFIVKRSVSKRLVWRFALVAKVPLSTDVITLGLWGNFIDLLLMLLLWPAQKFHKTRSYFFLHLLMYNKPHNKT